MLADRVVIARQGKLLALELATGKQLWQQAVPGLRSGRRIIAAINEVVFALGQGGLHRLDAVSGRKLGVTRIAGAQELLATDQALILSTEAGLIAQDAAGERLVHQVQGISGQLRGAEGSYVVLYQHRAQPAPGESPKRLVVVNLETGKTAYEFKLLPQGGHQVARVQAGRLSFIDYSRPGQAGSRRLFFTEADYLRARKLKDLPLSREVAEAAGRQVSLALGAAGQLFLASHGPADQPATLWAYDPQRKRVLWTRSGKVAAGGLLWHQELLWSAVSAGGAAAAVAYNPKDGDTVLRLELPGPVKGAPVAAGATVLMRLQRGLVAIAPAATVASQKESKPAAKGAGVPPDWQLYQDRKLGYYIGLPRTWTFDRARMRQLGGLRYVIPFRRQAAAGERGDGLLHVLTWEAAGRDADKLWSSVHAQRQRLSRDLKVHGVRRLRNVGGSETSGVLASYSFSGPRGQRVKLWSLCLVDHGVAFELRAQVESAALWPEVKRIFDTFRPQAF